MKFDILNFKLLIFCLFKNNKNKMISPMCFLLFPKILNDSKLKLCSSKILSASGEHYRLLDLVAIDLSTIGDKPRPPWLLLRPPTLLVNKYGRRMMF